MKKSGKIGACLVAAIMAVSSLSGCGDKTQAKGSGDSLTIEDGKLMVGLEIGYPPMEYFDEDGSTAIGFDVELAKALSEHGVKIHADQSLALEATISAEGRKEQIEAEFLKFDPSLMSKTKAALADGRLEIVHAPDIAGQRSSVSVGSRTPPCCDTSCRFWRLRN